MKHLFTDTNFMIGGTIATAYYKVKARDVSSQDSPYSATVSVSGAPGMGKKITSSQPIPAEFSLSQAYPNPFNPTTTISYRLPLSSNVEIMTFDIRGQLVSRALIANQQAGQYQYVWNGKDFAGHQVPGGIYIIKIKAVGISDRKGYSGANQIEGTQKVMLLKQLIKAQQSCIRSLRDWGFSCNALSLNHHNVCRLSKQIEK